MIEQYDQIRIKRWRKETFGGDGRSHLILMNNPL
jgi:hypothetical protein